MEGLVELFAWRVVLAVFGALLAGLAVGLVVGRWTQWVELEAEFDERDAELDAEWEELHAERVRLSEAQADLADEWNVLRMVAAAEASHAE